MLHIQNKKTHPPCFSALCYSGKSPKALGLQKNKFYLLISVFEELSAGIETFQIWWQNQLIFVKTLVCQEKSQLLGKIRHFWTFFLYIESQGT